MTFPVTFVGCWTPSSGTARLVELVPGPALRAITTDAGTAVIVGDCLLDPGSLDRRVEAMLRANRPGDADTWPGCCSTVLITGRAVTLLADPVGQFPLFVVADTAGEAVWFGSRATDVARHAGAGLDPTSLAVAVACPESIDLNLGRSMFLGVRQVAEGHLVVIDGAGRRERRHHPLHTDEQATLADQADRLRDALCASIEARTALVGTLTSDMSGGLDSTSLAFLAAGHTDVAVLTSYNPDAPVEDDLQRTRRYVRTARGLHHHLVPLAPDQLPYQEIGPAGDAPHGSSVAMGPLRSRLAVARALGSDVHLMGEGGDVVVGAPPAYFADLARRGELGRLWRDCVAWARLRGRAPLALFRRALLLGATTRRRALRLLATSLERADSPDPPTWESELIGYWSPPHTHWLPARTRRRLAQHVRAVADGLSDDDLGVGEVVTLGQLRHQTRTQQVVRAAAAETGVAVHAPFLDTAVVRACLALPARHRADLTVAKPLLRAALTGLVPDAVLARRTKGDYTRDAYQGVRRAAPQLRRLLSESVAADHGLIEPGPVRAALEGAVSGLPTPWGPLNQVLAVETWLRGHESGSAA